MAIGRALITEKDYLRIIDISRRFTECKHIQDLNDCLKEHLLPFIDCDSMAYGWRDLDFIGKQISNVKVISFIGLTKQDTDFLQQLTPYSKSLNRKLLSCSRAVVACDVDIPREIVFQETMLYSSDHPDYQCTGNAVCTLNGKVMTTYMTAYDKFETGLGMAIHRLLPNEKKFTPWELRVIELVRPILFQTIRSITLSEELAKYKIITELLANIPSGVALVKDDMRVVFVNEAFHKQIPLKPGYKLPSNLEFAIKNKMNGFLNPQALPDTLPNQPFYELPGGTFRLSIDLINKDTEDQYYLLRLKATDDAYSQLGIKMQSAELSNREKEICCLVKDGFSNDQIGERLFISHHTVKTHMKNIYRKFTIPSRSKLVTLLNMNT